jgi:hypothetical protein
MGKGAGGGGANEFTKVAELAFREVHVYCFHCGAGSAVSEPIMQYWNLCESELAFTETILNAWSLTLRHVAVKRVELETVLNLCGATHIHGIFCQYALSDARRKCVWPPASTGRARLAISYRRAHVGTQRQYTGS